MTFDLNKLQTAVGVSDNIADKHIDKLRDLMLMGVKIIPSNAVTGPVLLVTEATYSALLKKYGKKE